MEVTYKMPKSPIEVKLIAEEGELIAIRSAINNGLPHISIEYEVAAREFLEHLRSIK